MADIHIRNVGVRNETGPGILRIHPWHHPCWNGNRHGAHWRWTVTERKPINSQIAELEAKVSASEREITRLTAQIDEYRLLHENWVLKHPATMRWLRSDK